MLSAEEKEERRENKTNKKRAAIFLAHPGYIRRGEYEDIIFIMHGSLQTIKTIPSGSSHPTGHPESKNVLTTNP